ncbi:MAG: hypothetical protein P4M12_09085 [Gammaproteobacteria bacterium]|nr:hypothetical protein [Gammaproteobacteria bacterium]
MDSIKQITEKIKFILSFDFKRQASASDLCCVSIDTQHLTLVYIRHRTAKPELDFCVTVPYEADNLLSVLTDLVKQHKLEEVDCCWMLTPNLYQLLLLEELPVSAGEFQAAIRWKVRDLLSFPVDDSVIDTFSIPLSKIPGSKATMMVVIAQASLLKPFALQIHASGMNLTKIDIPELGFRNISSLYEKDEASTALIYIQEKNTSVIISRQKTLYLSRRIEWGLDLLFSQPAEEEQSNHYLDVIALEIQRSFDYYQSQWRTAAPTRILLASIKSLSNDMMDYLSQRLSVKIQNLNLSEMISFKEPLDLEVQNRSLAVIGGALDKEIGKNAAD